MCGISGIVNLDNKNVDVKLLKRINDAILHRGPDDEGFFVDKNVGLAARRLSIIDLSTGHQPIDNEDSSVWITFNGEIYNYPDLRDILLAKGHKFKSKTDTEAIVHLYEQYGMKFLSLLNGMFAFAIYDRKRMKVILARDRMGEKPLYYSKYNGNFIFASEIKAILQHPDVKRKINLTSLYQYLSFEYVPSPNSIFKDIYKLPPAHYLILDLKTGKISVESYWEIKFDSNKNLSLDDNLADLDKRLFESVKSRMIADVPLGIFLSGGLDSSTIAYYMTKISPGKVKSFSIGFQDPSFDESFYARKVSSFLGTEHREQILEPKKALDLIPNISGIIDEPMADSSLIPTYLLSKFTRKYVKVALGGDGGDELFMGYPTYQAHKLAGLLRVLPKHLMGNYIPSLVGKLPVSFNNFSFDFKLKRFFERFNEDPIVRNYQWLGSFTKSEADKLIKKDVKSLLSKEPFLFPGKKENSGSDELEKIIYLYLIGYLPEDILVKTDRASMFASLETRAPFLDHTLVNFINSIPVHYKLHSYTTKYILKKLMENRLPKDIVYRRKKGFGIPLSKWLTKELKPLLLSYLGYERILKEGIFEPKRVETLVKDHLDKRRDNRKELWTLLVFEMWKERWKAEI